MTFEQLLDKQKYQSLPDPVIRLLHQRGVAHRKPITHTDTLDKERLEFLLSRVSEDVVRNGAVDIRAHSGYFTISLSDICDGSMEAIEGDPEFVSFIETVANELGLSKRINANPATFQFSNIKWRA
jgi:hypothetical protein